MRRLISLLIVAACVSACATEKEKRRDTGATAPDPICGDRSCEPCEPLNLLECDEACGEVWDCVNPVPKDPVCPNMTSLYWRHRGHKCECVDENGYWKTTDADCSTDYD